MKSPLRLRLNLILLFISATVLITGCKKDARVAKTTGNTGDTTLSTRTSGPPNIIFLLADDMGYEMPTFNGGQSYNTTHLDSLAANGMIFDQCRGTPLCSPSRVELLSGLYNFRNYLKLGWGSYNPQYISYARVLQKAGYKTCVVGKWQLDNANIGIESVGFDNYCVWGPTNLFSGFLYKNPDLYDESGPLTSAMNKGLYSEDITSQYAMNFIQQNKNKPFFIYYSFMLIHEPFQPTPLDPTFQSFNAPAPSEDDTYSDTTFVGPMTHYMDVKVGVLINKLKSLGLEKNTIIVFTGDNGSQEAYHSVFKGKEVMGEKSFTTELGTHVPLFVYWPGHIAPGEKNDNLIDFSDFAPTFLDMANVKNASQGLDGVSFYPQLFGQSANVRNWTYCYYDPFPITYPFFPGTTLPISYAQDKQYKLYKTGPKSGNFYNFLTDPEEVSPIPVSQLTPAQTAAMQNLQTALNKLQ